MAKLTLADIASFVSDVAARLTYTQNNALIEEALENTLSRDGTSPNTMSANLDLNSQKAINSAEPTAAADVATKNYVDAIAITEGLQGATGATGATGPMDGPSSSVDNTIARFDSTTGKLLQKSGVSIDDDDNLFGHGSSINAQTGTTYTLAASDNGKVVTLDNASAITLTLPQTSTLTLAQGFQCVIVNKGAGQVTVAKEGSDTVLSKSSNLKLSAQGVAATILKTTAGSPNAWALFGDLAA